MTTKATNPKDAIGVTKAPLSTLSGPVLFEMGEGMLEGGCKYGRHNYRVAGVRASVYFDAAQRHLWDWFEGEDIDPASGINHIGKALSCLHVLRDSMIKGNWVDDRPPKANAGWMSEANDKTKEILARFPDPVPPYTEAKLKQP